MSCSKLKAARNNVDQVSYLKQKAVLLERQNQWETISIMLKRRPTKMKDVIDQLVDLGVERPTARDITSFGKRGKKTERRWMTSWPAMAKTLDPTTVRLIVAGAPALLVLLASTLCLPWLRRTTPVALHIRTCRHRDVVIRRVETAGTTSRHATRRSIRFRRITKPSFYGLRSRSHLKKVRRKH